MVSGWHHHGDYESAIYILSGALRMEFGPEGEETFEAGPGDFVFVGAQAVHRESDPSDEQANIVVVRAVQGDPVINVAGPGWEPDGTSETARILAFVTVLGGELAVPCTRDPLQRG